MTNTAARSTDPSTGGSDPTVIATLLASWDALAGAARAALSMIPTSEAGRTQQEPLLRELAVGAGRPGRVAPDEAITTGARRLVESTLVGLREPAGIRPYDTELAHRLRRRVFSCVAQTADEVAGLVVLPGSPEHLAVTGVRRAGQLARDLLAEDPQR